MKTSEVIFTAIPCLLVFFLISGIVFVSLPHWRLALFIWLAVQLPLGMAVGRLLQSRTRA